MGIETSTRREKTVTPTRTTLATLLLSTTALGQTITVNTLEDISDFGGARQVGDLPGPDGLVSFREAVTAANNTPGPQTIAFAIPMDQWWLVDDMAVLKLEDGAFIVRDDQTTIDFSTQTDFTGDTNPHGREVGIYGLQSNGWGQPAIIVMASECEIRGLGNVWQRGSAVSIWSGQRNRVVGSVTAVIEIDPGSRDAAFNVIGGTEPGEGNVLTGVSITCGAHDNLVIGNTTGTVFVGASQYCESPSRNRIGGPTPEERNVINGYGEFAFEGQPIGEGVRVEWATDTLIEGNYIGITEDGSEAADQIGPIGVYVLDSTDTTVRRNVIAGLRTPGRNHFEGQLFGEAIRILALNRDNTGTVVEGNIIGADATGQHPIETLQGIVVSQLVSNRSTLRTTIGGVEPGRGNTVRFTERTGIRIDAFVRDAEISGNSISDNGLLGIDLRAVGDQPGVTPNDDGDGDTGANGLQNFPVLDLAETTGSELRVVGSLNSRPERAYRVEFFANAECDPSGHGEGERFLGAIDVSTDGAGDAPFDARVPAAGVPAGAFVTATATDTDARATSEFSACIVADDAGCPGDFNGDGVVDTQDVLAFLNAWTAGDDSADFNGDGAVNTLDVLAFLNAWSTGC
jgi:hypothetical protein